MKGCRYFFVLLCWCTGMTALAQDQVYLFSYFVDNGQDGLRWAYSEDGLSWQPLGNGKSYLKPELGKDKLMRDPCVIQGPDGTFHMVWTTGWWDRTIGYASSPDLIHWSEQQLIPVMTHEPAARNSWAPEIFYDDKKEEFLIFWATTIPGRHSDVGDTESENGLNHRMYGTRTTDFQTFTPTELFFNPAFSVIDATIFRKGKLHYLFVKNENLNPPEKNIRVTKSRKAAGPYPVNVSAPITGDYWAEGPTVIEIDGYVYVYFDKYRDKQYGAVRSKNLKKWEDVSHLVTFPKGLRHGTVLEVSRPVFEKLREVQ